MGNSSFTQKVEEYREQYEIYLSKLTPEERVKAEEMDGWNKHKKTEKAATHSPSKDSSGSAEVGTVISENFTTSHRIRERFVIRVFESDKSVFFLNKTTFMLKSFDFTLDEI